MRVVPTSYLRASGKLLKTAPSHTVIVILNEEDVVDKVTPDPSSTSAITSISYMPACVGIVGLMFKGCGGKVPRVMNVGLSITPNFRATKDVRLIGLSLHSTGASDVVT